MPEDAKHPRRGRAGELVVAWLRSPAVRRGLLMTAVLGACFVWAMAVLGMSFAMVEHGVRRWWLVLGFGVLVLVVAVAAAYGILAFWRLRDARDAARHPAARTAWPGAPSPTSQAPTATVAARPVGAGGASGAGAVPGDGPRAAARPPQPPARTAGLPVEPLSQRELEVLAQLAAGRSNSAIAEALSVAPGTVKAHLNHIFRKLDATSRLQAVAHAHQAGLLDGHEPR